jgi:hypothetical protein
VIDTAPPQASRSSPSSHLSILQHRMRSSSKNILGPKLVCKLLCVTEYRNYVKGNFFFKSKKVIYVFLNPVKGHSSSCHPYLLNRELFKLEIFGDNFGLPGSGSDPNCQSGSETLPYLLIFLPCSGDCIVTADFLMFNLVFCSFKKKLARKDSRPESSRLFASFTNILKWQNSACRVSTVLQCGGSMRFWYGSGSGFTDPYH